MLEARDVNVLRPDALNLLGVVVVHVNEHPKQSPKDLLYDPSK